MYTSVIIFSAGMVLLNPAWYMYLAFILLVADLILKLKYEEIKLLQIFEKYDEYKKNSYCLIPFIY
jgi:protein-S-isoprenylcysteine O-methyltransferase Ste14